MGSFRCDAEGVRSLMAEDVATVLTRYRLQGRYRDQDIDTVTTETLVLRTLDGAWKIVHVHWSSA
jgi:ketosteroid isomerase-like protein